MSCKRSNGDCCLDRDGGKDASEEQRGRKGGNKGCRISTLRVEVVGEYANAAAVRLLVATHLMTLRSHTENGEGSANTLPAAYEPILMPFWCLPHKYTGQIRGVPY
jgi:hypothetical protein